MGQLDIFDEFDYDEAERVCSYCGGPLEAEQLSIHPGCLEMLNQEIEDEYYEELYDEDDEDYYDDYDYGEEEEDEYE